MIDLVRLLQAVWGCGLEAQQAQQTKPTAVFLHNVHPDCLITPPRSLTAQSNYVNTKKPVQACLAAQASVHVGISRFGPRSTLTTQVTSHLEKVSWTVGHHGVLELLFEGVTRVEQLLKQRRCRTQPRCAFDALADRHHQAVADAGEASTQKHCS
jgi:hypothetical protein